MHEKHKVIPLSRVDRIAPIDREIASLTKAISDLEASLGKTLQPQIDTFADTYAKHAEISARQADRTKALLEGNNGEAVKNVVCPGYHDFFTGYLRSANGDGSELPSLFTENGRTSVQIPVELVVEGCETVAPGKVRVAFRGDTSRFLRSLEVVRTVEYKLSSSENEANNKWIALNEKTGTIGNFSFGAEYSFRAKYALKDNPSSFAYGKVSVLKHQDNAPEMELAKVSVVSAQSSSASAGKESEKSEKSEPHNGPEYEDISYMENGIQYYCGTFRKGQGYRLSSNDTVMTVCSNEGWENPGVGTVPFIPGVRNRWFYMFRKSSVSWVTVGITTDPSQNPRRSSTSFWGLSFHNKRLVKGAITNFSTIGDFPIPGGLDTDSSVFGLELDMRSEANAKLYVSFWNDLRKYSLAFGSLNLAGKDVYPAISAYNLRDEFQILGEFPGFDKSGVSYNDSTGAMLKEEPVSTREIVLKKEDLEKIFGDGLDSDGPLDDSKILDIKRYIDMMKESISFDSDGEDEDEEDEEDGEDEGEDDYGEDEGDYPEDAGDDYYHDEYEDNYQDY